MNNIYLYIRKHPALLIIFFYLIVSFIFNYPIFWAELIHDSSQSGAVIGEIAATEWGMEQVYQKLRNFQNPFTPFRNLFYPFGVDVSTADIGFGFHFLYLRPFFSPHQSLMALVLINFFLANICMYALLRKLGLEKLAAFLVGLSFGYMTFVQARLGHLTYTLYYIFPLFFLSFLNFLTAETVKRKMLFTFITTVIFVLVLWQHIYYFVMLLISIIVFFLYFLITETKQTIEIIRKNIFYFFLGVFILLLLLIPWLTAVYETIIFSTTPKTSGWGGAIEFSSDLLGFFVPSVYNFYYGHFVEGMVNSLDIAFAKGIFENFTYPGIIILFSYAFLIILLIRDHLKKKRKQTKKIWKKIKGYFFMSIVFGVLTLGPFLHVAGRWRLLLDEGIYLVLLLPYFVLHFIPFLNNIRSPGRFIVPAIFFSYIVVGYLLSYFIHKLSKEKVLIISLLYIVIFFIDHRYPPNFKLSVPFYFPKKIYSEIKKDASSNSVLEIPFTVRDGFTYFGDESAIYQFVGNYIHKKPFIGGYSGRIPEYIKDYYENNAFIGYLGRVIDENVMQNGSIDRSKLGDWHRIKVDEAKKAAGFLNIKHIILNTDKPYAATLSANLQQIGYKKILRERNYIYMVMETFDEESVSIDLGKEESLLQLGIGWSTTEEGKFRWARRKSSVLMKLKDKKNRAISFTIFPYNGADEVAIYIDRRLIGKKTVGDGIRTYVMRIPFSLKQGINEMHFIFRREYNLVDGRQVAAKFYAINLIHENE